jgi:hypothetical protein
MNEDDDNLRDVFQDDKMFGVVAYDSAHSFTGMRRPPHTCKRASARSRESLVSGINAL